MKTSDPYYVELLFADDAAFDFLVAKSGGAKGCAGVAVGDRLGELRLVEDRSFCACKKGAIMQCGTSQPYRSTTSCEVQTPRHS